MEHKLQLKYILGYVIFVVIQLSFLSPHLVVGVNVPVVLTYLFDLLNHQYVAKLRDSIEYDTSFIALLLTIASIILIFVDIPLIGTTLLIFTIAVLSGIKKGDLND